MNFEKYIISSLDYKDEDTFILQIKPMEGKDIPHFTPGQFAILKYDSIASAPRTHSFSIASSPNTRNYLEFCVKIYGSWTKILGQKKTGETIELSGPYGRFTYEIDIKEAIFLAGGIGIAPIMSMLRFIQETQPNILFYLFYGNRTTQTILYKDEIENILSHFPNSQMIHILSHLKDSDPWEGYRGFITPEIIQKEAKNMTDPTYFICGPPIFVQKMKDILNTQKVNPQNIKQELI
ncbi:FAD-dependent oxidoreductase [Candidatus Gottesmanbacteria bacterium]|nr:FAD-dependent oxidoreductase [Candidatus Gottesmanbacteria bacterium]